MFVNNSSKHANIHLSLVINFHFRLTHHEVVMREFYAALIKLRVVVGKLDELDVQLIRWLIISQSELRSTLGDR